MPVVSSSTGSTVTSDGYNYHIFTNTGTGANNIRFLTDGPVEYLIIAGGGAGGSSHGGGGGAGEVVSGSKTVSATIYTISVGEGGLTTDTNGGDSSIFNITCKGGGRGGGELTGTASNGGSGGGGSGYFYPPTVGSSTKSAGGLGNAGGVGGASPGSGGGGGGAGSAGSDGVAGRTSGGNGGAGTPAYTAWINAISTTMNADWREKTIFEGIGYIASGGAGGSFGITSVTTASKGGGGNGGTNNFNNNAYEPSIYPATVGTANTGGGGGGGGSGNQEGAAGGSGLIVIRYKLDGNINALSLYLSGSINGVSITNPSYNVPAATSTLSTTSVSLYATNVIASGVGFALNSDERIKKNIQYLSAKDSYELIKALKPATFQYVDFLKGTIPKYGYLAQEVESVLPYAVNKNTGYIPTIFETVKIEKDKVILQEKTTEYLATGMKLQFYDLENTPLFRQITEILDEKTFYINEYILSESIFLYGQEVDDYRSIDTDQINTLLLSALQETQNKIDKRNKRIHALRLFVDKNTK